MAKKSIHVAIVGDSSSLERAFGRAQTSGQRVFGNVTKMAKVGGLAIAAGLGLAVKSAGNFEQSLNVMQAVSGATGTEMKKVSAVAKQLGADTKLPGTSAKDAADAMVELAKGGLSVRQSMKAARGVLQLSAAAQIENAEAATITARALNSFALKGDQAARVADLLAAAANASTAEIGDVAAGMQQASASAHQLGIPIEDLTTSIALMANAGIAGSDAGTSLKTMISRLVPQTEKATKAMISLGLATDDGKSKFFDAQGQFLGLEHATKLVTEATKGMSDEQRQATMNTIFGSDAIRAANVVLAGGADAFDKMKGAVTAQGAAQKLAEAQTKGFNGSLEAFKSTLETLAITFGKMLLPAVTKSMNALSNMAGKLEGHQKATVVAVAAVASLVAMVLTVNAAMKVYTAATIVAAAATTAFAATAGLRGWVALLASIRSLRDAQILLNMALMANPIGLVITAIALLAVGLVLAWKRSDTFREITIAAFKAVKDAVATAISLILTAVDKYLGGVQKMAEVASKLPGIGDKFRGLADKVGEARERVRGLRSSIDGLKSKDITVTTNLVTVHKTFQETFRVAGAIGSRAHGGPVRAKRPYLVGEKGPELFMPGRSGSIIPSFTGRSSSMVPMRAAGAGTGNVIVNVSLPNYHGDKREIAQLVRKEFIDIARSNGVEALFSS